MIMTVSLRYQTLEKGSTAYGNRKTLVAPELENLAPPP